MSKILLNRYRIVRELGRGGLGIVLLVDDTKTNRKLALKTLNVEEFGSLHAQYLKSEFKILAGLAHPNLVQVYDFGRLDDGKYKDSLYFTSEYVEGVDIQSATEGQPLETIYELVAQLCRGLEYIHAQGIVHGDIKPPNILVTGKGNAARIKLVDFGLAKVLGQSFHPSGGTFAYMAPEVPFGILTPASDLYSLGVVLFELATRRHPFRDLAPTNTVKRLKQAIQLPSLAARTLPDPKTIRPDLPDGLARMMTRLAARDPAERLSRANLVIRSLNRLSTSPLAEERGPLGAGANSLVPFVGREQEYARLKSLIEPDAKVSVAAVLGEQGSGKTRLIREFETHCQINLTELRRADPADVDAIRALACRPRKSGEPLAIVELDSTRLSPDWKALLDEAATLGYIEVVTLEPLAPHQTREFVRTATPVEEISPAATERIQRLTGGNLAMLTELARQILATPNGVTRGELNPTVLDRLTQIPSLESQLRKQYEDSAPRGRRILEFLSLFRTPVPMAWLLTLLQEKGDELIEELRGLEARRLIQIKSEATVLKIHLDHELLREVIIREIPDRQRQRHSLAIAKLLEESTPHHGLPLVEIAHHYAASGNATKTIQYNVAAARYLKEIFAHREAARCYEAALEAGAPNRTELTEELAEVLERAGEFRRAAELYQTLEKELEGGASDPQTNTKRSHLATQRGLALQKGGDLEGAMASYRAALGLLSEGGRATEAARLYGLLAMVQVQQGRYETAITTCREALDKIGERRQKDVATIHNALGLANHYLGDPHAAIEHFSRSLAIYESLHFEAGIANAANNLGLAYHQARNADEALKAYQKAHATASRQNDRPFASTILGNLATIEQEKGHYDAALKSYQECLDLARELGNRRLETTTLINLATLHTVFGAADKATALLEEADRCRSDSGQAIYLGYRRSLQGDLKMTQGDFRDALGHYQEAQRIFDEIKMKREAVQIRLAAVEAHLELGEFRQATDLMGGLFEITALGVSDLELQHDLLAARLAMEGPKLDLERADILLGAVHRYLSIVDQPERRWEALFWLATLKAKTGKRVEADALQAEAVRVLRELAARVPEEYRDDYLAVFKRKRALEHEPSKPEVSPMKRETLKDKRFARLLEINRRMNAERNVRSLLEYIMDSAIELTGSRRGFLILYDTGRAVPFEWKDIKVARHFDQTSIPADEAALSSSVINQVLTSGEMILTDNATEDSRMAGYKSVHALKLCSILAVPLKEGGKVIGVLYVDNPAASQLFDEDDVALVQSLADLAVVSLRNVKSLVELSTSVRTQGKELARVKNELEKAKSDLEFRYSYSSIIGQSEKMQAVFRILDRVTETTIPVLIYGESGTGKELVAKALHYNSPRRTRHFVSENCTAIPENLLESELFGHVKGAFTGADRAKEGLFRYAHGGTLFLDEIGDMPLSLQSKLLRVLQEGVVRPVGGNESISVDTRIVSASHRNLKDLVQGGQFRQDLFYRLNGITVSLPPLRERREDIPLLVRHFIDTWAPAEGKKGIAVPAEIMELFLNYPWPGNIRELEQSIRNAVLFARRGVIDHEALSFKSELFSRRAVGRVTPPPSLEAESALDTIADERERIIAALKKCHYNKSEAAKALGVTRKTLYNKLQKHGIAESVRLE